MTSPFLRVIIVTLHILRKKYKRSVTMNLAKFPRKKYTESYTPIEKLNNFSEALGA